MSSFSNSSIIGDTLIDGRQKTQLVDSSGNPINTGTIATDTGTSIKSLSVNILKPATQYYSVPVQVRQTATSADGTTVWTMRHNTNSTKIIYLEEIDLTLSFDNVTLVTRATLYYNLCRFDTATPSGGSLVDILNMDSNDAGDAATARVLDTGLTTTGVNFFSPFTTLPIPGVSGAIARYQRRAISMRLDPAEGICIRLNGAAGIGQGIAGNIVFSQR